MSSPGAVRDQPGKALRMRAPGAFRVWVGRHLRALLFSMGEMWRAGTATALTVAVIGVALALPAALHVAVQNASRLGGDLDEALQVSLFLQPQIDDRAAAAVAERLRQRPGVAAVEVIGRAQALAEYVQLSGLSEMESLFGASNPLPAVLVVTPRVGGLSAESLSGLTEELSALPEVEAVESDLRWSRRLAGWTALVQRLLFVIAVLLGGGVLLVIGNTVRVAALGRREEIAVARLCGATDSFIRRPFLYAGLLYGLIGAALAAVIVFVTLAWLSGPVRELSELYLGGFMLRAPGYDEVVVLLLAGCLLGTAGAWFAVGRMLSSLEP